MATVTPIGSNSTCNNVGGAKKAYVTDKDNITAITVVAGVITAFTMVSTGLWARMDFDDENNVAFFNEEGELVGSKVLVNGTGLMKFNGLSQAKITAANNAKACCGLVIIWVHYSGIKRVEGIDVAPDNSWDFSKIPTRIIPNALSDTGENEERLEYNVQHQGLEFSATTDLTDSAIEAL